MNLLDLMVKIDVDDRASGKLSAFAAKTGQVIGTAAKVGAAAMTAFAATSVKTGMDFDKAMSQVAATMGKNMSEMESEVGTVDLAWGKFTGNLRDYAQEMGAKTAFSATQAAEALNYMALAGYDTQTSMQMLPNVLNLAAAGNMDLARASDMVTDTQTAFGISIERTSQMVDEMAKASSTGNTSVQQLGDAFLTVGGLAKELNGGYVTLKDGTTAAVDGVQELEIALTAMANAGIKGSEAGTHMRNMLLKLSSPTADGTKRLEEMGVAVFDTEGKMRSLKDVFSDLNGALSTMTQQEKIEAISELFNTRDMASAEAMLAAIEQDWDNIGESILNAEGAAQKMADTQLDNLAGDITLFKSAFEGLQIAVSDKLTPSLRGFVQAATVGTSALTQMLTGKQIDGLSQLEESLGRSATEAEKFGLITSNAAQSLGMSEEKAGVFAEHMTNAFTNLSTMAENFGTKVGDAFAQAFSNMPEIDLGAAIEGASAALATLGNFSADAIVTALTTIQDLGSRIGETVGPSVERIGQAFDSIGQSAATFVAPIAEFMSGQGPAFDGMMERIGEHIADMQPAMDDLAERFNRLAEAFQPFAETVGPLVAEAFGQLGSAIVGLGPIIIEIIAAIVEFATIVVGIVTTAISAFQGFIGFVGGIPGAISGFFASIPGAVIGFFTSAASGAQSAFESAVSYFSSIPGQIASFFSGIPGMIMGIFSGAGSWLYSAGASIINGLISGVQSAIGTLAGVLGGITSMIPSWKGPEDVDRELLVNNGQLIMDGLIKGIGSREGRLESALGGITNSIAGWDYGALRAPTLAAAVPYGTALGSSNTNNTYNITLDYKAGDDANKIVRDLGFALRTSSMMEG